MLAQGMCSPRTDMASDRRPLSYGDFRCSTTSDWMFHSTWLWTELKKFGLPVICIDVKQTALSIILARSGVKVWWRPSPRASLLPTHRTGPHRLAERRGVVAARQGSHIARRIRNLDAGERTRPHADPTCHRAKHSGSVQGMWGVLDRMEGLLPDLRDITGLCGHRQMGAPPPASAAPKHWKRDPTIYREPRARGMRDHAANRVAGNGRRCWHNSALDLHVALPNKLCDALRVPWFAA